ncbi:hypothetical protein D3C74_380520 [compost metagenome]
MLEVSRTQVELQLTVADLPVVRNRFFHFPLSAAGGAAVIVSVHIAPLGCLTCQRPDNLRVRAAQDNIAPAFQLFSASGINNFVVFPIACYIHHLSILQKFI